MRRYPVLSKKWYFRTLLRLALFALLLSGCSMSNQADQSRQPLSSSDLITAVQHSATGTQPVIADISPISSSTPMHTPPTPTVAPTVVRYPIRAPVPALCYHHIRDWMASDTPRDRPYIVPRQRFAEQMDFLAQQGYHTISPDQLVTYLITGTTLPTRPILLTFDDGDSNQWTEAVPVLQKHHFTATFFIMTVVLDRPYYLSRAQVQQLDKMGMTIGAHTWDHHAVTKYNPDDWDKQIIRPTKELANLLGHPIKYFAYPYGLWNKDALAQIKQAGFVCAFQLADQLDLDEPLYTIRRVIVNGFWSTSQFQHALAVRFS